jgi:uncharacterized membrane protein YeaQ/YmgE (transglycosylase-associated protein family)
MPMTFAYKLQINLKHKIMFKKITLISTIVISNITGLVAQTLSIGPIVGLNVSKFTENQDSKNLVGLLAGALANYSVNENLGLSAKVLFSQLGSKYNSNSYSTSLNYIQMPISLVYYFGKGGNNFRPKIYGGPYFGRLMGAKDENKNEIAGDIFRKLDIGGQVGLGFNYLVKSRTWLNVDLGYGASFTDITKSEFTKEYNTAITLNLGLSFPIGRN